MKRIKLLILFLSLVCMDTYAEGDEFWVTIDGYDWRFTVTNEAEKTCEVAQQYMWVDFGCGERPCYMGPSEVNVPSEVEGYRVTALGNQAFEACGMDKIQLPDGIVRIGWCALNGCENLTDINLPENLTEIEGYAFQGCVSLKNLILPQSLISIGESAFNYSGIEEIEWPENVKVIPRECFMMASLRNIVIPSGITSIGEGAFEKCNQLQRVIVPESVTSIGPSAFKDCTLLESLVFEGNLAEIPSSMCLGCSSLTSFNIPDGVTTIGGSAFQGTNLQTVIIPESVVSIGKWAFYCYYDSRKSQGIWQRYYTLRHVYCLSSEAPHLADEAFFRSEYINGAKHLNSANVMTLTIPDGSTAAYTGADGWSAFPHIYEKHGNRNGEYLTYFLDERTDWTKTNAPVEMTFRVISEEEKKVALQGVGAGPCISKTAYQSEYLTVPNEVCGYKAVAIGRNAFREVSVRDVEFPATITEIESCAFTDSYIDYITLPSQVTFIGDSAFSHASMKYMDMPRRLRHIGREAFYGCSKLLDIELPSEVKVLGRRAFFGCSALRLVTSHIKVPAEVKYAWVRDYPDSEGYFSDAESELFYGISDNCVLRVPQGTRKLYYRKYVWSQFSYLEQYDDTSVPEISPQDEGSNVLFSGAVSEADDLTSLVMNNVYFTLDPEQDYYDPATGSIVLMSSVSEEQFDTIGGLSVGDSELEDAFDGIIFEVPAGYGRICVDVMTSDSRLLCVKIGEHPASRFSAIERHTIEVAYENDIPQYVYIYAEDIPEDNRLKANAMQEKSQVRIYGMSWEGASDATSLEQIGRPDTGAAKEYYSVYGYRLSAPQRGMNIIRYPDGTTKKVFVK